MELSDELQRSGFRANNLLIPPVVKPRYEPILEVGEQVGNILDEVFRFALRKGVQEEFERTVSFLTPAATSNQFEEALRRLGELLGYRAQRPEHQFRVGSDVLWLCGTDRGFVIECKHRKDPKNLLTKEEHGQFLTSLQWGRDNYTKREISGFIVHPTLEATAPAAAEKTSVMDLARLGELVAVMRQFYVELSSSPAQGAALEKRCAELVDKYGLAPAKVAKKYLSFFKVTKMGRVTDA